MVRESNASGGGESRRAAREAAVVILYRRRPRLEVYRVLRAAHLAYLGGFHAFPGGAVSERDAAVPVAGLADPAERARRASAARELFEEVGVLLARPGEGEPKSLTPESRAAARAALDAGRLDFADFLAREALALRADDFVPAGRWISPPFLPRAFDTHFYLVELPRDEEPGTPSGELSAGEWVAAEAGLAAWRRGESLLATPVRRAFQALSQSPEGDASRDWGPALRASPEAKGGAVERIEVTPGAVLLPVRTPTLPPATHTNCLVWGEGECLLIDPGASDATELEATEKLLANLREEGRRVSAIAVTHHHGDHWGGVAAFKARLQVPVLSHPLLAERISAERALADGERIPLASASGEPWVVEAHFTPGHTRDHVAYVERTRGVLAAGDLLSGLSTVVIDPPDGHLGDYLRSLERLLELPIRVAFPGHGPPMGAPKEKIRELIAHRGWRADRVRAGLAAGEASLEELVPRVYDDVRPEMWKLAERSLLAHLLDLVERGEASRREEGGRTVWALLATGRPAPSGRSTG